VKITETNSYRKIGTNITLMNRNRNDRELKSK